MKENNKEKYYYIKKIENNKIYIGEVLLNKTSKNIPDFFFNFTLNSSNESSFSNKIDYDSIGAAKYTVVVILLYAFSIIFFIGSQVRSTEKSTDDADGVNAVKVLRSMDTVIFTREVSEKLSNKELRDKAWKIYLADKPSPDVIKGDVPEANHLLTNEADSEIDKESSNLIEKKFEILNEHEEDKMKITNDRKHENKVKKNSLKQSLEKKTLKKNVCVTKLDTEIKDNLEEIETRKNKTSSDEKRNKSALNSKSKHFESNDVKFHSFEISEKISSV